MKKVILVPALLGVMGIGGILAVAGGDIVGSANSAKVLAKSEIEKKVLAEVDGKITEMEFEVEGSISVYEVEVVTLEEEYDLKFNAITGDLLKKTKDYHDDYDDIKRSNLNAFSSTTSTNQSTSTPSKASITTSSATQNDDDRYDDDRYDDDIDDDDDRYDD